MAQSCMLPCAASPLPSLLFLYDPSLQRIGVGLAIHPLPRGMPPYLLIQHAVLSRHYRLTRSHYERFSDRPGQLLTDKTKPTQDLI
jgi:hypothetical protein